MTMKEKKRFEIRCQPKAKAVAHTTACSSSTP